MREIAAQSHVALGGIYNHFGSKEAIFRAIVEERHPLLQVLPVLNDVEGKTLEEFVRNAAGTLVEQLRRHPDFLNLMLIEIVEFKARHVPALFRKFLPLTAPLVQRLAPLRAELRDIPPMILARAFLGMFFSYYITEMLLGRAMPPGMSVDAMDHFVDIFLHGVLEEAHVMNTRLLSIIRKEFIQIRRDVRTLAIIIVMPIMQLFLLGYAATTDVKNISLAVWDQSRTPQSRQLLDAFRSADYFRIRYVVGSEDEYRALIEEGRARAALIIPPDYDRRLLSGNAQVSMVLDGSDATVGGTALSAAKLIGQAYATKVLSERAASAGPAAVAGSARGGADAGLVQPGSDLCLLQYPRCDRHDLVVHHRHADRHRGRAGTRAWDHRTADRDAHPLVGTHPGQDPAVRGPGFRGRDRGSDHRALLVQGPDTGRPWARSSCFRASSSSPGWASGFLPPRSQTRSRKRSWLS